MPKPVEGRTKMVGLMDTYNLQGVYIGSVFSLEGTQIFIAQKRDGQIFAGTKGSIALIETTDDWFMVA